MKVTLVEKLMAAIVKFMIFISKYYKYENWQPGKKLKILLIGYNGKRNTGADVRVVSIVKQLYHIFGEDNIQIGIITFNKKQSEVYYKPPAKLEQISTIFFWGLLKKCSEYHVGVLSEGACLKSKFSNALLSIFIECSGILKRQNKCCIGYGCEAGDIDKYFYDLTKKICKDTYFIARNQNSLDIMKKMKLKSEFGTDTAWIFPSENEKWVIKELKEKTNWDGKKKIIGVAVINPYWWPVKPSILKWIGSGFGIQKKYQYEHFYFYSNSKQLRNQYRIYLESIAEAVNNFQKEKDVHVVILGMEALDWQPNLDLQKLLDKPAYIFNSRYYDGYKITALLRKLSLLITSRYHANVLAMPAGVPTIAISMDERLYNLLGERNHLNEYYIKTDDTDLYKKLITAMNRIWENNEKVKEDILKTVPNYLQTMQRMGMTFHRFIKENFPEFQYSNEPRNQHEFLPQFKIDNELSFRK